MTEPQGLAAQQQTMETVEKRAQALLVVEPNGSAGGYAPGQVILFEQFRLIKKTWWWVLLIALAITGAVGWYAFTQIPVQYKADVVSLPPNKSGTPLDNILGGVASSLKDVGLSRLVGKPGGAGGYENTVFYSSRALYDSLIHRFDLYNVYNISPNDPQTAYAAVASNLDVYINSDGPITFSVYDESPERAMKMANAIVPIINSIAKIMNSRETEPITQYMRKYADSVRQRQGEVSSRLRIFMGKNKLFDPEGQAPALSSALLEAQGQVSANRAKVSIYTDIYGADDPRTQQAVQLLQQAEQAVSRLASGNTGAPSPDINNLPSATVEYMNLRQEYEVNLRLLAIIEPMVMQAQFDAATRDIPILNVLDPAMLPNKKARPKRSLIVASAFAGSLLISYFAIALVSFFSSFRRRYKQYDRTLRPVGGQLRTPVPPTS